MADPFGANWLDSTGPVIQSSPVDWSKFYTGVFSGVQGVQQMQADALNASAKSDVPKASESTKLLNRILGPSPFSEYATDAEGNFTSEKNPGFLGSFDFGHELSRVTIIVLGFIFVAVGLSMFKPVQAVVSG